MKYARPIKGAAAFAILLFLVTLSAAIASWRVSGYAQDQTQKKDKPVYSVTYKPIKKGFKSSSLGVDVNLIGLKNKADWIVGVVPLKENEQEEVTVSIVRWTDSEASKKLKIERIDKVEDYPSDLVEVTPDAVDVRGSDSLSADTTLVIYMKVRPEAQIRLLQDSEQIAKADNPAFVQRGFVVKNGAPIGTPVGGFSTLLNYLQTERITKGMGKYPKEVTLHETN